MDSYAPPRCFYCAEPLEGPQEPEHILPAALGCELVTTKVHTACNHRAGSEVDQPWLREPEVVQTRQRHKVRDRRGGTLGPLTAVGHHVDDGTRSRIRINGDIIDIQRVPFTTTDEGEITAHWYTDDGLATKLERLQRRNPAHRLLRKEAVREPPLRARVTWELSVHTWPRFAAKVALGIASLLADDAWHDTTWAQTLRDVLWQGHPESTQDALSHPGVAWSARPFELRPDDHPLRAPEHLLTFESTEDDTQWLVIVMFAEFVYRVPLPIEWDNAPPTSWWFSPTESKGRRLPAAVQWFWLVSRLQDSTST